MLPTSYKILPIVAVVVRSRDSIGAWTSWRASRSRSHAMRATG